MVTFASIFTAVITITILPLNGELLSLKINIKPKLRQNNKKDVQDTPFP
jgi:hypothetical protein